MHIDHKYLPPYSPFINPIEYAFNMVKSSVSQSEFHNRGELIRVIQEKNQLVTADHAKNFIDKASYYPHIALGKPLHPIIPTENTEGERDQENREVQENIQNESTSQRSSLPWYG